MKNLSDEDLFLAFQQDRDVASLSILFRRRSDELLRLAMFLVQRPSDAEDLVQATFLNAIARADSYRSGFRVMSWLCGILTNNARMLRRAARRVPPASMANEVVQDPVSETLHEELRQVMRSSIAALGEPYRSVLTLHLDDGLNSHEISERLHRPAATVRKQMARAIQQLRQVLPLGLATGLLVKMNPAQIAAHAAEAAEFVESAGATIESDAVAEDFDDASLWCEVPSSPLRMWWIAAGAVVTAALGIFSISMSWSPSADADLAASPPVAEVLDPARTVALPDVVVPVTRQPIASVGSDRTLTVTAVDPDGVPHAGLEVICVYDDGRSLTSRLMSADVQRVTTDDVGVASFHDLTNGRYQLTVAGARPKTAVQFRGEDRECRMVLPGRCRYSGTVTGPQGRPVAGASVFVGETAGRGDIPHEVAVTNVNGYFEGSCLLWSGQIFARHPEFSQSVSRRMKPGRDTQLELEPLADPVRVRVVDHEQRPIADCFVAVVPRSQSMNLLAPIVETTDQSGRCVLAGPGNRRATVIAQYKGMAPAKIDLLSSKEELLITMGPSTRVEGVVRAHDGEVCPNREIILSVPGIRTNEPVSPMLSLRCRSDARGRFVFEHAPRAELHMRIFSQRKEVIGPPMSQHVVAGLGLDTRDGDVSDVELVVRSQTKIKGTLRTSDGRPVAGYYLLASPSLGTAQHRLFRRRSAHTDADGRFELADVVDDEVYHVGVYPPGRWWPNEMTWPVAIAEVRCKVPCEIVIDANAAPSGSATCQVLRPDGKPARRASVEMRHLSFQSPLVIRCDTSGVVTFDDLLYGDYWMTVAAPGLGSRTIQVTINDNQHQLDLGTVQLEQASRVVLRMVHNGARPIFPVRVVGRGAVGDKFVTAYSQSSGTASLPAMPPGKSTLLIHGLGIAPCLVERELKPGLEWIDVELESATPVELRFPFPRADNPFLVNGPLHVRIFDEAGELVLEDYVGATRVSGCFDLATGLRPGTYRVKARSLWNALADGELVVPGASREVTAELPLVL